MSLSCSQGECGEFSSVGKGTRSVSRRRRSRACPVTAGQILLNYLCLMSKSVAFSFSITECWGGLNAGLICLQLSSSKAAEVRG